MDKEEILRKRTRQKEKSGFLFKRGLINPRFFFFSLPCFWLPFSPVFSTVSLLLCLLKPINQRWKKRWFRVVPLEKKMYYFEGFFHAKGGKG